MPFTSYPSRLVFRSGRLFLALALLFLTGVPSASAYGLASISISNASLLEGDSGTADMLFTVTRTGDINSAVTVGYTTRDGTALAGVDYTAQASDLVIPAGAASAGIRVPVIGNNRVQGSRSFSVDLTGVADTYGPPAAFAAQQSFGVGSYPTSVASGDFNVDGRPDLATANAQSYDLSVLLNLTPPGAPAPVFASQPAIPTGIYPFSVAIADFNADGRPDLAASYPTSGQLSVMLNVTTPGALAIAFAPVQFFATGLGPYFVAVGDFNADGRPDLVSANKDSNDLSVLLNITVPGASAPVFDAPQSFAVENSPLSVAIGDFNLDGRPDLAAANSDSNDVSVLLNTTAPGATVLAFASPQSFAVGSRPASIAVGDFNADGRPDLVTTNMDSGDLSVLLNTTPPGGLVSAFAGQQSISTEYFLYSVVVGDFNADGRPDLAATNTNYSCVSLWLNITAPGAVAPAFAPPQSFAVDSMPFPVAVGDFNTDGLPDLAAVNPGSTSVSVLLNAAAPGGGTPVFTPEQRLTVGESPVSAAVADFNRDGKPDLVSANLNSRNLSMLLNTAVPGAAAPAFAVQHSIAVNGYPQSVAVGDFNADGAPDLVSAIYDTNTLSLVLNATVPGSDTPVFAAQQSIAVGINPISVVVVDFNSDGKPDLASANFDSGTLSVLFNITAPGAAAPAFAPQNVYTVGGSPVSLAVGDINSDGRPDLVVVNYGSRYVSVMLNSTNPGAPVPVFTPQHVFDLGGGPYSASVADFNSDGKLDLAVANSGYNLLSVLVNTTLPGANTPTFAPQQNLYVNTFPTSATVGDFNGDGRPDLVATNQMSNNISLLLNTTAPGADVSTFAPRQDFAAGNSPETAAVSDFNADGRPDLAVANFGSSYLSVLLNQAALIAASTATGDILDDDTPAAILPAAGDNQSAAIYTPFALPLTAEVRNAAGTPVEAAVVTFSAPGSGPSGVFASSAALLTDASGRATAPVFTANGTVGEYQVTASVAGVEQSASFSLANAKQSASVTLGNLAQGYDGAPKPVVVTTVPPGLLVDITYEGSTVPPTEAGSYTVTAAVNDPVYQGSASGELVIAKAPTATLLRVSSAAISQGFQVTLTARVSPVWNVSEAVTGTVTFYEGSNPLGVIPLIDTGGEFTAALTVSDLAPGRHTLTAAYTESANFQASASDPANLTVLTARLFLPLIGH